MKVPAFCTEPLVKPFPACHGHPPPRSGPHCEGPMSPQGIQEASDAWVQRICLLICPLSWHVIGPCVPISSRTELTELVNEAFEKLVPTCPDTS